MYIYDDLCSVFHYVMLIFLNSVENELIYVENKGCHWRRVCDIWCQWWDRDCQLNNYVPRCVLFFFEFSY